MIGIAVGLAWCLWAWRRGKSPRQAWPAVALAAGSGFLLYLASTPLVARWAAWTLERENPAIAVERLPVSDAIVVLGGSMYATQREDGSVHLYAKHGSDRFDTALAAYRAGGAQYTADESQLVAERLREREAKSLSVCSSAARRKGGRGRSSSRVGWRWRRSTGWRRSGWGGW